MLGLGDTLGPMLVRTLAHIVGFWQVMQWPCFVLEDRLAHRLRESEVGSHGVFALLLTCLLTNEIVSQRSDGIDSQKIDSETAAKQFSPFVAEDTSALRLFGWLSSHEPPHRADIVFADVIQCSLLEWTPHFKLLAVKEAFAALRIARASQNRLGMYQGLTNHFAFVCLDISFIIHVYSRTLCHQRVAKRSSDSELRRIAMGNHKRSSPKTVEFSARFEPPYRVIRSYR
jgi:hypothetical protein